MKHGYQLEQRKSILFTELRSKAIRVAQEWATSVAGKQLPIPLHELATLWKVRLIKFLPLLSNSGLQIAPDNGGFFVVINTEAHGTKGGESEKLEITEANLSCLEPTLRFAIAHEVAHLIFLDLAGGRLDLDLWRRHQKALESACNEMASLLLIPSTWLSHVLSGRVFDVEHQKEIIEQLHVSPEVFVRHLQLSDVQIKSPRTDGLLVLARERDGVMTIVTYKIWGPQASSRFGHLTRSRKAGLKQLRLTDVNIVEDNQTHPFSLLKLDRSVDDLIRANRVVQSELNVQCGKDIALPCKLRACRFYDQPLTSLVSIEVKGEPYSISQS